MNNKNIKFVLSPPMEKLEKSKNVKQNIFMNVENVFLIYLFLHIEYYLFSQINESSLEQ